MTSTLTGGPISTTFKKLVFTDATTGAAGNLFYTDNGDGVTDNALTTFTSAMTFSGLITATADIKLGNNTIKASDGGTAITLDTSDNVAVTGNLVVTGNAIRSGTLGDETTAITLSGANAAIAGNLTVTGNNIISSGATAMTLSSDDVTVVGDLTVTGTSSGTMTLGADADDVDRSIIFGHATLKSIMGIDDDQNVFAINTDATFQSQNDFEIDASGNVGIAGNLTVIGNTIKGDAGTPVITFTSNNAAFANEITVAGDINMTDDKAITFNNSTGLKIEDQSGVSHITFLSAGPTFNAGKTVILAGPTSVTGIATLSGNDNGDAGAGITSGTDTICKSSSLRQGDVIYTNIILNIKGLQSDANGDVIAKAATTSPAYLTKITTAKNGTIMHGKVTCLVAPTADIEFFTSTDATLKESDVAASSAGYDSLCIKGTWAIGDVQFFDATAIPVNNELIYIEGIDATNYSAGQFVIEMWGTV